MSFFIRSKTRVLKQNEGDIWNYCALNSFKYNNFLKKMYRTQFSEFRVGLDFLEVAESQLTKADKRLKKLFLKKKSYFGRVLLLKRRLRFFFNFFTPKKLEEFFVRVFYCKRKFFSLNESIALNIESLLFIFLLRVRFFYTFQEARFCVKDAALLVNNVVQTDLYFQLSVGDVITVASTLFRSFFFSRHYVFWFNEFVRLGLYFRSSFMFQLSKYNLYRFRFKYFKKKIGIGGRSVQLYNNRIWLFFNFNKNKGLFKDFRVSSGVGFVAATKKMVLSRTGMDLSGIGLKRDSVFEEWIRMERTTFWFVRFFYVFLSLRKIIVDWKRQVFLSDINRVFRKRLTFVVLLWFLRLWLKLLSNIFYVVVCCCRLFDFFFFYCFGLKYLFFGGKSFIRYYFVLESETQLFDRLIVWKSDMLSYVQLFNKRARVLKRMFKDYFVFSRFIINYCMLERKYMKKIESVVYSYLVFPPHFLSNTFSLWSMDLILQASKLFDFFFRQVQKRRNFRFLKNKNFSLVLWNDRRDRRSMSALSRLRKGKLLGIKGLKKKLSVKMRKTSTFKESEDDFNSKYRVLISAVRSSALMHKRRFSSLSTAVKRSIFGRKFRQNKRGKRGFRPRKKFFFIRMSFLKMVDISKRAELKSRGEFHFMIWYFFCVFFLRYFLTSKFIENETINESIDLFYKRKVEELVKR